MGAIQNNASWILDFVGASAIGIAVLLFLLVLGKKVIRVLDRRYRLDIWMWLIEDASDEEVAEYFQIVQRVKARRKPKAGG